MRKNCLVDFKNTENVKVMILARYQREMFSVRAITYLLLLAAKFS